LSIVERMEYESPFDNVDSDCVVCSAESAVSLGGRRIRDNSVDASVVIRLQAPDTTSTDLAAFVNLVQPGFGGMIPALAPSLGMVISNPTLAGVDMSRDWYLALFAQPVGPPDIVLLIPATDAAKMRKGVNAGFQFVEKDKWVAYSRSASQIEHVQACLGGTVQPISSIIDRRNTDLLNAAHLATFVNVASLKQIFADKLEAAETNLDEFIDAIASQVPAGDGKIDLNYVWDMY